MSKKNNFLLLHLSFIMSYIIKKIGLIVLCLIMCGIGFDVYKTLTYQPQYMSSMNAALKATDSTYSQLEQAETYNKTLQYILNGQVVKNEIMEKMNVDDLNMKCQIINQSTSNIVSIQVIAPTKKEAYYSLKYIINWYQNNAEQYHLTYQLNVLEDIVLYETPIYTNSHLHNFRLGTLFCLLFLLVIIALIVYFKPTIKTSDEIEKLIDCRLFSKIPKERKKRKVKKRKEALLITSLKTSFYYKEAIKKLRNRFEISSQKHGYQSIMITSTVENEGKSTIAANLALSLVQSHHKVLLIDGDIRKPSLHKIFSIDQKKNINQYLQNKESWQSQVQYIKNYQLSVLCAKQNLNLDEKLLENRFPLLIKEAKRDFDYIIIDVSPTYGIDEPMIINSFVDASFLVVKQNEASVQMINDVVSRLVQAKNNLIGCIYNGSVFDISQSHKVYGYRYGYNRYSRTREVR